VIPRIVSGAFDSRWGHFNRAEVVARRHPSSVRSAATGWGVSQFVQMFAKQQGPPRGRPLDIATRWVPVASDATALQTCPEEAVPVFWSVQVMPESADVQTSRKAVGGQ
jgi:hypothetical protein